MLEHEKGFLPRRWACRELRNKLGMRVCPFCHVEMTHTTRPGHRPNTQRTKAHLYPRSHERDDRRIWISGCAGCNTDQGGKTLHGWAERLRSKNDPRYENVRMVLLLAQEMGAL
jgi:hypothetical protein